MRQRYNSQEISPSSDTSVCVCVWGGFGFPMLGQNILEICWIIQLLQVSVKGLALMCVCVCVCVCFKREFPVKNCCYMNGAASEGRNKTTPKNQGVETVTHRLLLLPAFLRNPLRAAAAQLIAEFAFY